MTSRGTADSAQLRELTKILDDYCQKAGLQNDRDAREALALRIMNVFESGIDDLHEITKALDSCRAAAWRQGI
ncbi:hypothetical protein [Mesorhizobium sp. STM 4661]|uniref:hypothetical protein n=1 Tax=Mesorhizobium sp. STM 4661 TaxID=1297570 RepID=UPI00056BE0D9|nr:hypothetical protein [Mesorhizobium sp. STM 4661]